MTEHIHQLGRASVTYRQFNKNYTMPDPGNAVRVYRYSPDRVLLQIRGTNRIMSVTLPFEVARLLAEALIQEAGDDRGAA